MQFKNLLIATTTALLLSACSGAFETQAPQSQPRPATAGLGLLTLGWWSRRARRRPGFIMSGAGSAESRGRTRYPQFGPVFDAVLDEMDKADLRPYDLCAGPELDQCIHLWLTGRKSDRSPAYSSDRNEAERVCEKLRNGQARVVVGETRLRIRRWFARYENGSPRGTEALAVTPALAICRLVLVLAWKSRLETAARMAPPRTNPKAEAALSH